MSYKVLDLFAGCGGFSNGFQQCGFDVVAANEFWVPAQKTYAQNHIGTRLICGDVTLKDTKEAIYACFKDSECDVIIGGPPCQAYSLSGLRDVNDPRGRLFEEYVEIVKYLKPKIFVMENVKGILSMRHPKEDLNQEERDQMWMIDHFKKQKNELLQKRKQFKNNPDKYHWNIIRDDDADLKDLNYTIKNLTEKNEILTEPIVDKIVRRFGYLGYRVEYKVLNAVNYGVPQKRERVIFIGTRIGDKTPLFPDEKTCPELFARKPKTVRQAIDDLAEKGEDKASSHLFARHSPEFEEILSKLPVGKSAFEGYGEAWYRNPPDEPAVTVKENHGGVLVHYSKPRVMTPRELARLQSFSDDFLFWGNKGVILKQIGNAVPPLLGKAIGSVVKMMLEGNG